VSRDIFSGSVSIVACSRSSCHCFSTLSASASRLTRAGVSKLWQLPLLEAPALKEFALKRKERLTISPLFGSNQKALTAQICIPCWPGLAILATHHPVPAIPLRKRSRHLSARRFVAGSPFPRRRFASAILQSEVRAEPCDRGLAIPPACSWCHLTFPWRSQSTCPTKKGWQYCGNIAPARIKEVGEKAKTPV
jgi:hypothetical protein